MPGAHALVVELNFNVIATPLDAGDARRNLDACTVLDGGCRQGSRKIGSDDEAVRWHEQSAGNVGRQLRLGLLRAL